MKNKSTAKSRVLRALLKRNRVTRKTAIEKGWCENLTATISRLRDDGHVVERVLVKGPPSYTRYRLVQEHGRYIPSKHLVIGGDTGLKLAA
jgi:hypothetical protein|tara:strand:+ start:7921 stop:8193 length:273 start_codon:yes stop_codon:yes gene_type:complete